MQKILGTALILAFFFMGTHALAQNLSKEECRALHGTKRKTALERWRGPHANANKYPRFCELQRNLNIIPTLPHLPTGGIAPAVQPSMQGNSMPSPPSLP